MLAGLAQMRGRASFISLFIFFFEKITIHHFFEKYELNFFSGQEQ